MDSQKVILGYWAFRGLGQVPRLLLAYTGAVWEDVQYTDRSQWLDKDKKELGLDFPNLPYLIEGDFKITESNAVCKYIIARSDKKDLLGKNIKDSAVIEQVLGVFTDLRTPLFPLFFDKDGEAKIPAAFEKVNAKLDVLQAFYGEKKFALGYLTLAEFNIAEISHFIEKLSPDSYKKYPFLQNVRNAIEELPETKKYYEQATAIKGPFLPQFTTIKF